MGPKTAAYYKRQKEKEFKKKNREMEEIRGEHAAAGDPGLLRDAELVKIGAVLADRKLAMVEVPGDGDCVFSSFAHQHRTHFPDAPVPSAAELRATAAEYMLKHPEDFEPFLEEPLASYVVKLTKDSTVWGGESELVALSKAFSVAVIVLVAEDAPTVIACEGARATFFLVYLKHFATLGAHYNATVRLCG